MILLDTNVILRHLVVAEDETSRNLAKASTALFQLVRANQVQATLPEVVLHEVCYVLGSKKQYGLRGNAIRALVAPLFELPGIKVAPIERQVYLRALEIYADDDKLGSGDALVLARCELQGLQLVSHDRRMTRFPTVNVWSLEAPFGS